MRNPFLLVAGYAENSQYLCQLMPGKWYSHWRLDCSHKKCFWWLQMPVRHAWLPLRRMIHFLLLLLLLPQSRMILLLTSRKQSREMLSSQWCWHIPSSGTIPMWHRQEHKIFLRWLTLHVSKQTRRKIYLKPSKCTCMLSLRECCKQTRERHWSDWTRLLQMLDWSLRNYARTHQAPPAHPSIPWGSSPTSRLWGLGMACGMELYTVSFSTGKSKFDYTNP